MFLSGCSLFPEEEEPVQVPLIEVENAEFSTIMPERGTIERTVEGTAYVVPLTETKVSFEAIAGSGILAEMNFHLGDRVNVGDILCSLENEDLSDQMYEHEWEYRISSLSYQKARERYNAGELDDISWEQAKLSYYRATKQIEKYREIYETTILYSPVSGIVTDMYTGLIGEPVSAGVRMYSIADTSILYVLYEGARYDEIPLYSDIKLTLETETGSKEYVGKVVRVPDSEPENTKARYNILINTEC